VRAVGYCLILCSCLPQVGPPIDGGGTGGGAATGCPGYANCVSFVSATQINFDNGNFTYAPQCVRVQVGQTLTFTGNFTMHPLIQQCGPAAVLGQNTGTTASYVFSTPGTYGFYCGVHGLPDGEGMAGAIEVVR
jgi:plastocyanin